MLAHILIGLSPYAHKERQPLFQASLDEVAFLYVRTASCLRIILKLLLLDRHQRMYHMKCMMLHQFRIFHLLLRLRLLDILQHSFRMKYMNQKLQMP